MGGQSSRRAVWQLSGSPERGVRPTLRRLRRLPLFCSGRRGGPCLVLDQAGGRALGVRRGKERRRERSELGVETDRTTLEEHLLSPRTPNCSPPPASCPEPDPSGPWQDGHRTVLGWGHHPQPYRWPGPPGGRGRGRGRGGSQVGGKRGWWHSVSVERAAGSPAARPLARDAGRGGGGTAAAGGPAEQRRPAGQAGRRPGLEAGIVPPRRAGRGPGLVARLGAGPPPPARAARPAPRAAGREGPAGAAAAGRPRAARAGGWG